MQQTHQPQNKSQHIQKLLYSREQAADTLGISLRKFDYLISRGEIAVTRIDRRVLLSHGELLRFIDSKTVREEVPVSAT
ncbi:MAG: hypothetical protein DMG65_06020 [Candidatus Angelobacter sp. Gp1-AA117]|nr:MAG: hypothetical protein DMG65_06020 [Candidatus Angelobacter sp. Gp1-AA117]